MTNETTITTPELRAAFKRSGLWRLGWSYSEAIAKPAVYRALSAAARCRQEAAKRSGRATPTQPQLF